MVVPLKLTPYTHTRERERKRGGLDFFTPLLSYDGTMRSHKCSPHQTWALPQPDRGLFSLRNSENERVLFKLPGLWSVPRSWYCHRGETE